jgi:hypothetical protein
MRAAGNAQFYRRRGRVRMNSAGPRAAGVPNRWVIRSDPTAPTARRIIDTAVGGAARLARPGPAQAAGLLDGYAADGWSGAPAAGRP